MKLDTLQQAKELAQALGMDPDFVKQALSGSCYFYYRIGDRVYVVRVADHPKTYPVYDTPHLEVVAGMQTAEAITTIERQIREMDEKEAQNAAVRLSLAEKEARYRELAEPFKAAGYGFFSNERTRDDLEAFKSKAPHAERIMQVPLGEGFFRYDYISKENTFYSRSPRWEYLDYITAFANF